MKSIYLNAGKTQDIFNDLKDNFNGTLVSINNEFNLTLSCDFAKGHIRGITFPDGMTHLHFDVIFQENLRLSMESPKTSPIFFAYCSHGSIQHSFGELGDRKIIDKQNAGILKSASNINSVLHFKKQIPIKLDVIQIGTSTTAFSYQNIELIKKLKNAFSHIKDGYLVSSRNFKIPQKIEEMNMIQKSGNTGNLLKRSVLENILELEIEQHTDTFSEMAQTINAYLFRKFDEIKRVSNLIITLSLELFTTDLIMQKTILFANNLRTESTILLNRRIQDFLIYIRIERERI